MLKPRIWFHALAVLPALAAVCFQTTARAQATPAPTFTQFIIFGDSLSDVGNDSDVSADKYDGLRFPGPEAYKELGKTSLDYTDGRFTDGGDTNPAAVKYVGVWHEQLASLFLGVPLATASLDGGFDYAYGGALTEGGTFDLSYGEGPLGVSITIDNMGKQVDDFLSANPTPDAAALYIVWGGANDLFTNDDNENAVNAAARETALIQKLAEAGAKNFLVPNLPPLEKTPDHAGDAGFQAATIAFNTQLKTYLDGLPDALAGEGVTGVTIYQLDVYGLFQRLLVNKYAYGFTDISDPSQTDTNGIDPDTFLFWDGVHPTTFGHYQVAAEAYTVLTGIPVVEVYPREDNSGFYLTRTGPDVSEKLKVYYKTVGDAVAGEDYEPLSGYKKLRPGHQSVVVGVTPTDTAEAGRTVKLKLKAETYYNRPVVKKATIKLGE